MAPKRILLVISLVSLVHCENKTMNHTNQTSKEETSSLRRGREIRSYIGLFTCAMKYDVSCFVDAAEDYLEVRRIELLAEADAEVLQSTSRSDPDSRPSHVANTLGRLISELTNIFENGISGYFKEAREATDDDEGDELETVTTNDSNGVARASRKISRGHKKNKDGLITKIVRLVKNGLYALVFYFKLLAVLFMFNTYVNFKLLLVAMWGVALIAVKVWILHKSGGEQVVVHEDVHHDHHYEDEHHFEHLPVEDWHRSYLPKEGNAQKLAYRGQKPTSSSWSSWLD